MPKKLINCIGNWYIQEYFTYIRIFGAKCNTSPLARYVQITIGYWGDHLSNSVSMFIASLPKEIKKKIFIPYGFKLGHYFIKDPKHAQERSN
jgi:hypothetical protein